VPRAIYIPDAVRHAITANIDAAITKAKSGYLSENGDEDTFTGQLGANLRTGGERIGQLSIDEIIAEPWR
jgi:hypothetical protein